MKEILAVVRKSSIFSGIADEKTESVLHCLNAKVRGYRAGESILHAGDRIEAVGLLLSGSILVMQEDFWVNRNLMTRIIPVQLFAESFACAQGTAATVNAVADAPCDVMWLNVRRLLTACPEACSHHSRMIQNLLSALANKNLRLNEKLTHMGQRTTKEKLLSYLSAEAQRYGTTEFDISFNRQQLADYLSVERSAMSAELCKLRDDGVLCFEKNHFRLLTKELRAAMPPSPERP